MISVHSVRKVTTCYTTQWIAVNFLLARTHMEFGNPVIV